MNSKYLLDLMGEIDARMIEDAAGGSGGSNPVITRLSRYGVVAAAIGIVSFSAFAIYGVVRDGIMQQQPQQPAYSSILDSGDFAASLIPHETQANTEAVSTDRTLPTDLYVIETLESTTTTTTEKALPFPADAEMPDASLEQEIGDRFLINDRQIVQSGVLALTVQKAQCFDTLEEAGLKEENLGRLFREDCYIVCGHGSYDKEKYTSADVEYMHDWDEERKYSTVKANPADYRFVLLDVKVENINAISYLPSFWNDCRMPVDPSHRYGADRSDEADWFDPFRDDYVIDSGFARDYDFCLMPMLFMIHNANERKAGASFIAQPAYFSLSGQEYDDDFRSEWFYLEPGSALNCQIGAFLPKTMKPELMNELYQDAGETEWGPEYPAIGDDLRDYYYFGSGGISRPHVDLHFDDAN